MKTTVLDFIKYKKKIQEKIFVLLIDPDKQGEKDLEIIVDSANKSKVDLIFVGGSLLKESLYACINTIKKHTEIPVTIFPGSHLQIAENADSILFLALLSGRNPEFLIGQHVLSAFSLKRSGLEIIPTSYILIDGGVTTSVQYISNTMPIPATKSDIALATALAGEMLGHKIIYLEAGSGATKHVPVETIRKISLEIESPIIVGGGIKKTEQIRAICEAGADVIVVGTAIEKDLRFLKLMVETCHEKYTT